MDLNLDYVNDPHPSERPDRDQLIIALEMTIESLVHENERLREQTMHLPERTGCSMAEFLAILFAKLGHAYAWKVGYMQASEAEGCRTVNSYLINKWQRTGSVPIWAVEQIDRMIFEQHVRLPRGKVTWTRREMSFLSDIHTYDPTQKNAELAKICANEFGRPITENAIRGQLDRLRRNWGVPHFPRSNWVSTAAD